ncbi:MAG: acetate--CoA ligase family protein, partial [Desulfurococcales archaeon]|nr:acetate--CoA ligase family protein [Desulfurococcales archaeon]
FPAVAKVVSPDISHKSDVGGVILNIKNSEEAVKAYRQIMENVRKYVPRARVAGVLYQKMAEPGYVEVIVGATRDPTFGPVIMFGIGGIFVEILKDVSFRVAPLEPKDAEEMIREIKTYKILEGYRGMPPRDIEAVKDILMRVSKLMLEVGEVQDIDLNPIMLYEKGRGAVAVDVRVILKK